MNKQKKKTRTKQARHAGGPRSVARHFRGSTIGNLAPLEIGLVLAGIMQEKKSE